MPRTVAIGRFRRDLGTSFASFLATDRESAGGVHNRVVGPDFRWQPNDVDSVTGQFLYSDSRTPSLPDLASEWDGRHLSGHGGLLTLTSVVRPTDHLQRRYHPAAASSRRTAGHWR